jgi:hypothetical protein
MHPALLPGETSRRKTAAATGGDRCGKGDVVLCCAAARDGEPAGGVDAEQGRHRLMSYEAACSVAVQVYVCRMPVSLECTQALAAGSM